MVIMYGRLEYDVHAEQPHDFARSSGPNDVAVLQAPENAGGCVLSVETAPVRARFDGEDPGPESGIVLHPGTHFLAIGRDIRFVSEQEGESAAVSVLWVRVKLQGQPST